MEKSRRLTLPPLTPPLPNVDDPSRNRAMLVVVRALAHHRELCPTEEYDEGELRQVDLMDLPEELLPHTVIRCRKFLLVKGIQFLIAIEVNVVLSLGWDLIAR